MKNQQPSDKFELTLLSDIHFWLLDHCYDLLTTLFQGCKPCPNLGIDMVSTWLQGSENLVVACGKLVLHQLKPTLYSPCSRLYSCYQIVIILQQGCKGCLNHGIGMVSTWLQPFATLY